MDNLSVFITEYLASIRGYYSRQVLVVCAIFVFGAVLTDSILTAKIPAVRRALLAFPVGLSAF